MSTKQMYRQIIHVKTGTGWEQRPFQPLTLLKPEQAVRINQTFDEHGIMCVPKNEYEKYLKNARLLN